MSALTVNELLQSTAALIEEKGWWDGKRERRNSNSTCLILAMGNVLYQKGENEPQLALLPQQLDLRAKALKAMGFGPPEEKVSVTRAILWNDAQTSAAPVLARIRGAIKP